MCCGTPAFLPAWFPEACCIAYLSGLDAFGCGICAHQRKWEGFCFDECMLELILPLVGMVGSVLCPECASGRGGG